MKLWEKFKKAAAEAISNMFPQTVYGKGVDLSHTKSGIDTAGYKAIQVDRVQDKWDICAFYWPKSCGTPIFQDVISNPLVRVNSQEEAQSWLDKNPMTEKKALESFCRPRGKDHNKPHQP